MAKFLFDFFNNLTNNFFDIQPGLRIMVIFIYEAKATFGFLEDLYLFFNSRQAIVGLI